jgi:flagellar hook protein FlgE
MDALGPALSGLGAASAGLAVQANNVANQMTAGYQAKRVDFAAQPAGGVAVQGVSTDPTPAAPGGSNVDLATEMVQGMALDVMYKANLKVVRAEDQRLKATLNLTA